MATAMPKLGQIAVALALLTTSASAWTQSPSPLDVMSVIERARLNDPQISAIRKEHDAVLLSPKEARAGLLPQLQLSLTTMRSQQRVLSTENEVYQQGAAQYPTRTNGIMLTVPLVRLVAWRKLEQAEASTRQSAFALESAELELLTRAATAYVIVLAARDALSLAMAERDAIAAQLQVVKAKRLSGLVAQHVLSDVLGRYEIRQAEILSAENELRDRMLALAEIVGPLDVEPSQLPVLRDETVLPGPFPDDVQTWVDSALAQNSQLKARRSATEVALAEIARHRAGYMPTLDLVVSNNRRNAGGSLYGGGSNVNSRDVMINLVIPIYEGGVTNVLVDQAVHRHSAAILEVERITRQVDRQTRTLFSSLVSGARREQAIRTSVKAFQDTRAYRLAAFRNGLLPVTSVLDTERDLSGALRDLAQVRYDQVINMIKLKQLNATLGNEDFLALSSLFDSPAPAPAVASDTNTPAPRPGARP